MIVVEEDVRKDETKRYGMTSAVTGETISLLYPMWGRVQKLEFRIHPTYLLP